MKGDFTMGERDQTMMTELDRMGMRRAAEENVRNRMRSGKRMSLEPLNDLLKRDSEREKDGFPKKIKFRRVLAGPNRVVNVPYVEEEKLFHADFEPKHITSSMVSAVEIEDEDEGEEQTGHGEGDVGDIIGHRPIWGSGDGDGGDDDDGSRAGDEEGDHAFEEEAYETGRRLSERLQLPNLKEKVKKVPMDEYTYDLTDRHKGSGQVLDKKETLKRIVKTNLILGRVNKDTIDAKNMIVGPDDRVFRVLSRERIWKAQAVVLFLRDYSGSMWGDPTKALVSQHLMIYSWLLVQYEKRVIPRFFVHDTNAREVSAQQYFTLNARGGTLISSGYKEINKVVDGEALETNYNIYVFQGTDGDDFDDGKLAIPEINKILGYANRMGVTLFKHPYFTEGNTKTPFETYVEKGNFQNQRDVFRMHTMSPYNVTEEKNIEALKALIAQD